MPYLLSNFDFVTASLTLIAGKSSSPARWSSYRRWTPVVVSSVTPSMPAAIWVQRSGLSASERRRFSRTIRHSWLESAAASGTRPASSYSRPLCTRRVASPPSSRIRLGPVQSAPAAAASALQSKIWVVHHQYSSSVSPFQAKTGTPAGASTRSRRPTATAAAASSWVEKMLQLAQRTCAPSATRVSMSTAVCTVMCSDPAMRAPFERLLRAVLLAQRHQARHLVLGQPDLVATRLGEGEVGDLEGVARCRWRRATSCVHSRSAPRYVTFAAMRASTASRTRSISSRVPASTLSRSRGSVFEGAR